MFFRIRILFVALLTLLIMNCTEKNIVDHNNIDGNKTFSLDEDSLYQVINPNADDYLTYSDKIDKGFLFIDDDLEELSFNDNEISSFSYYYKLDTVNNELRYYAVKGTDTMKVISEIYTNITDYKYKGVGTVYFNSQEIFTMEEKFTDSTLVVELDFIDKASHLSMTINYNPEDSLTNSRPFYYTVNGNILSDNINLSNTMNDTYNGQKVNEIKQHSSELFSEPLKNFTIGLLYLNNNFIGWATTSNSLEKNCSCVEPCYGNDDAWLSFAGSVITGLFNPIGGIVYGAIDTYIATHAPNSQLAD